MANTFFGANFADSQAGGGLKMTTASSWLREYAQFAVGHCRSKDMPDWRNMGFLAGPACMSSFFFINIVINRIKQNITYCGVIPYTRIVVCVLLCDTIHTDSSSGYPELRAPREKPKQAYVALICSGKYVAFSGGGTCRISPTAIILALWGYPLYKYHVCLNVFFSS